MSSRALSLATVIVLIGSFAALPVRAQNLEAGKSPSQIFAGTCSACHKAPRGLLKTVPAGSLPSFLRQHYTTSSDMAALLSAYLVSNGATDTRYGVAPPKQKDARPEPTGAPIAADARTGRKPRSGAEPQEAAQPDADGLPPEGATRPGRNAKRLARPSPENPDAASPTNEGQAPAAAAAADNPAIKGKKLGRKGKQLPETPAAAETAKGEPRRDEPAKGETAADTAKSDAAKADDGKSEASKSDAAKSEASKTETSKPEDSKTEATKTETTKSEPSKSEPSKTETGKSESAGGDVPLRADPVPAVTPAPKPVERDAAPSAQTAAPAPAASPPAASSSESASAPEVPAASPSTGSSPPAQSSGSSSAATAVGPPPSPAGPPAPPISQ